MTYQEALEALKTQMSEVALQAFNEGVASVPVEPPTGITPEQEQADIAAAVASATAALNAQIQALQLAKDEEDALLAQIKSVATELAHLVFP